MRRHWCCEWDPWGLRNAAVLPIYSTLLLNLSPQPLTTLRGGGSFSPISFGWAHSQPFGRRSSVHFRI